MNPNVYVVVSIVVLLICVMFLVSAHLDEQDRKRGR